MKICFGQYQTTIVFILFFLFQALHYNMEIFHLREKQIPVDTLDLKGKSFQWISGVC